MKQTAAPDNLLHEARSCQLCEADLPFGAKPLVQFHPAAPITIIGQAPGKLAHDSGIPWNDFSGERLRRWLSLDKAQFYSPKIVSVLPMSFCFPGYKNGADAPPVKACAPLWHPKFMALANTQLVLYVGRYAQQAYCPEYRTLTKAIEDYTNNFAQHRLVLPHPSVRNNRWFARHPWFEQAVIPKLQQRIQSLL